MGAKVVLGMSGGVDSSVSAYLLKKQGYDVIGLFMKNWDAPDDPYCTATEDFEDVAKVCHLLNIPYHSLNFSEEYKERVFQQFLKEYARGETPNPDILCNREIKFQVFYEKARDFGASFLATGHYAQTKEGLLLRSVDTEKDQTYFLYAISGEVLKKVLFPIGHLTKKQVRELAFEVGLPVAKKKDSTGICFIGERKFRDFLSKYIRSKKGYFKTLDGSIVGEHQGACFYTIGQRRGLGLGGDGPSWFVVDKDVSKNIVYVVRGDDHPALYGLKLKAVEESWISGSAPELPLRCTAKIRYRQKDVPCLITRSPSESNISSNELFISFDEPQRAITPRQSIVFYQGELCLGGAVIQNRVSEF